MNSYSPKKYWDRLAESYATADSAGFAPVLHPGAPAWFNELIDKLQCRAMRRALQLANVAPGAHALDVGCGTGRWVRRYQGFGFHALGVDATSSMLAIARKCGTDAPLAAAEAYRLPFADARFDCVSDITVVQHIPLSLQSAALGEMIRVLKPNGRLILMELIRGNGAHIFPHDPQEWIDQVTIVGGSLVEWFGQEYLLFDRVFVRTVHAVTGNNRRGPSLAPLAEETFPSQRPTAARGAYWGLRRVTTQVSNWLEPVAERIFPPGLATHGVFLFRKR